MIVAALVLPDLTWREAEDIRSRTQEPHAGLFLAEFERDQVSERHPVHMLLALSGTRREEIFS
jgi:hypothetical protein